MQNKKNLPLQTKHLKVVISLQKEKRFRSDDLLPIKLFFNESDFLETRNRVRYVNA